jgi:L-histidine N-alpha-methyltransferase
MMNTWFAEPARPAAPAKKCSGFLADVCAGLCRDGQKTLPPKYLYDELGSMLFDAITRLPEYGVWRAERRLLEAHAGTIAVSSGAGLVVELGSGSADKTRCVLEALLDHRPVTYCPVEISQTALDHVQRALADLDTLEIRGIAREYLTGIEVALRQREPGVPALVLFLGSSLGNFDPLASFRFLQSIRRMLAPGDGMLLGADLEKPESRLIAAYDDALGVTAAFNLNLLVRMNRELDADFHLPNFRHRVRFDRARRNVEMHIESLRDQEVLIGSGGFTVTLRSGETIHTENSHKYSTAEIEDLMRGSGFRRTEHWCDHDWQFATGLYMAA